MKKYIVLIIICCFLVSALGYSLLPRAMNKNLSSKDLYEKKDKSQLYHIVSSAKWEVDGDKVEARLETLGGLLKDAPKNIPFTRLSITNLATNETILEQGNDDHPGSMFVRVLNEDIGEALIVTWSTASADRIEIFDVHAKQARLILSEYYRIDAALVDLSSKGNIDVLITTASGGAGDFYTTRYVWDGKQYTAAGKVPYTSLTNVIKKQFGTP